MRRLLTTLLIFALLAGLIGVWQWSLWRQFLDAPINSDSTMTLLIEPGDSFGDLVDQLEVLGLAQPNWRWRVYGRAQSPNLKRGEFRIAPGQSIERLVAMLESGPALEHRFTIVEGWTFKQLRQALAKEPKLRQLSPAISDEALMSRFGCQECPAEGRFLPETYFFIRGSSDLALLERSYVAMSDALEEAWSQRADDLPIGSPDELLILASLIERETGAPFERPEVAGVFKRRLELGMRLQTDPTVVYGLDESFDGRIRRVHLRTDHPWNTYTRHGLPATAIALPGRASLRAAAQPAEGSSLYFVSRGDGTHHFSDTLREHNAAVDRYIRGR